MESGYEEGNRAEASRIKQCGKGNQMAWHATIQSEIDHEQRGRRVGYKTLAMVLKEDQREKTGHGRWQASRWNTQMERGFARKQVPQNGVTGRLRDVAGTGDKRGS